jgi:hypothetical protein
MTDNIHYYCNHVYLSAGAGGRVRGSDAMIGWIGRRVDIPRELRVGVHCAKPELFDGNVDVAQPLGACWARSSRSRRGCIGQDYSSAG